MGGRGDRLVPALLVALLALATIGFAAPGAGASPPDQRPGVHHTPDTDPADVVAYWTPRRMAEAIPAERRLAPHAAPRGGSVERGTPRTVEPTHHRPGHAGGPGGGGGGDGGGDDGGSSQATVTGATWTGGGLAADTTGKLFFTSGGTDYVCSGSVVSHPDQRLVLTAGHCVHDGAGGDVVDDVAFVPAYDGSGGDQVGPHGVWTATELRTTGRWVSSSDLDYDVGFIVTDLDDQDRTITEVVGGAQGIAFNQDRGAHVFAFGYPHGRPYDGTTLTYCAGETVPDPFDGSAQGVTCDMTGGSSGGPWYAAFDPEAGVGTAYSVNSYRYRIGRHRKEMFGPYFGTVVEDLYNDRVEPAG